MSKPMNGRFRHGSGTTSPAGDGWFTADDLAEVEVYLSYLMSEMEKRQRAGAPASGASRIGRSAARARRASVVAFSR